MYSRRPNQSIYLRTQDDWYHRNGFFPLLQNDNFSKCAIWGTILFPRKLMFRSRDIQIFIFFTISWFTKSVTSWWVLVHETGCIFQHLLNQNSWTHQTWSIDRYRQSQYFPEIFWTIWGTGAKFQVLFSLATFSNYSITNHVKFPVFHFLKGCIRGN